MDQYYILLRVGRLPTAKSFEFESSNVRQCVRGIALYLPIFLFEIQLKTLPVFHHRR